MVCCLEIDVCAGPRSQPSASRAAPDSTTLPLIGAALARARKLERTALPFRSVNRSEAPGYNPGMQRHHLLPRQLLSRRCFGPLLEEIGRGRVGFDDFRSNGLLLPASDSAALAIRLPLHRGPHRDYNAMVIERVGQVEASWSALRSRAPEIALDEALMRLRLLQGALRRRLLDPAGKPFTLNRHDPIGRAYDYAELDGMVEALWPATETAAENMLITSGEPFVDASLDAKKPGPLFGAMLQAPTRSAFAF